MTVERAAFVEFWPLVDVAKLELKPGDLVIVSGKRLVDDPTLRQRFIEVWQRHARDVACIFVDDADTKLIVKRAMPTMRAEDLKQPKRQTTMD
jgi:hypothetical protein